MRYGAVRRQEFTQGTAVVAGIAPKFTEDPAVTAGMDAAAATFTAGADGKYYWVVQEASVGMVPDADAVKAGQDGAGSAASADHKGDGELTADTAVPIQIGGLALDTSYRLFVLLTDATGAATSIVKVANFLTTEAEPPPPGTPNFTEDPAVMVGMDAAEATFTSDTDGKYYWVVQLASLGTAPDADAGQGGSGRGPATTQTLITRGDGDMDG